jgi:hypothetical protein
MSWSRQKGNGVRLSLLRCFAASVNIANASDPYGPAAEGHAHRRREIMLHRPAADREPEARSASLPP